jgi:hypothetical protein
LQKKLTEVDPHVNQESNAGPRPRQVRGVVPGLASSPVPDQQPRADRGRRHHPPPARDHETTFADLIDGPLAHLPSGRFAANRAWAICAAITRNLLRAAGTLASPAHAVARGATLRRDLIAVPARITRPQRRRVLHLPAHWPWAEPWTARADARPRGRFAAVGKMSSGATDE